MNRPSPTALALALTLSLIAGCRSVGEPSEETRIAGIHYLEIVTGDVAAQCEALARVHGVRFSDPVADLGQARVAALPDGTLVGVRAPLAASEQPITRTYFEVEDIDAAVAAAEAAGSLLAYPPTVQGETGTWAIYILGDTQHGLWQP